MTLSVIGGVLAAVGILVLLFIPVVVMVRLPPADFPTALPDGLGLLVFGLVGLVVGLIIQPLRSRPLAAGIGTVLTLLVAVWVQRGTWWSAAGVPAPPVELVLVHRPALVPVAGILLGVLLVAVLVGRATEGASVPLVRSIVSGAVAAAALVAVTEVAVWGRRLRQTAFEVPWDLGLSTWFGMVFAATLVAGALVGWIATSVARRPGAPAVAALLVLLAAARVWVGEGLGGHPRISTYGLAIGVLAVAALAPYRPRRRTS